MPQGKQPEKSFPYRFNNEKVRTAFKMYCIGIGKTMQEVITESLLATHPKSLKK